jgi:cytochrome c2
MTSSWAIWIFVVAWNSLVAVALVGASSQYLFRVPPWNAPREMKIRLIVVAGCYLLVASLLSLIWASGRRPLRWSLPVTLGVFGVLSLALLLGGESFPRLLLLIGLATSVSLAPLPLLISRARWIGLAVLVLGISAGWVVSNLRVGQQQAGQQTETRTLVSASSDLDLTTYRGRLPPSVAWGGAVVAFGDGFLLGNADGRFVQLVWNAHDELAVTPWAMRAPMNADVFDHDVPPQASRHFFRLADLLVQDLGDQVRFFASHHFWIHDRNCWVIRLSETTLAKGPGLGSAEGQWRTVFESQPCMPLSAGIYSEPFAGYQAGGAMALIDSTHVLLALGDHRFDGVSNAVAVSQDSHSDYGKTILVDVTSGKAEHFTMGHRNPQGLVIDDSGSIWDTEHGPRGGDELNRLERGANYGWPLVTYGTDYEGGPWPLSKTPGEHTGFRSPTYSWVPSVGTSGLIIVKSDRVPGWKGDFLVPSLRGATLWRLRIRDGRVVYAEPIRLGLGLRDVAEGADGRLVLFTDLGVLATIQPSRRVASGERLFERCAPCHPAGDGRSHGIGPDLAGVFGRHVASAPGYEYSPSLRKIDRFWTAELLSKFVQNPESVAPGTTMKVDGALDANEVAALLAYLKRL